MSEARPRRRVGNATTGEPAAVPKLLIVDDDPVITRQLSLALAREYDVSIANDSDEGWRRIRDERPELVTLDLALQNNDPETGFALLERCAGVDPYMKVILITGNDEEANALRAVENGAADFFSKPVDVGELKVLLRRVLTIGRRERQIGALLTAMGDERRLGSIVGQSPPMRSLFRKIEKVAPTDISVLILGESGTGKELVAREVRRLSRRAAKPFVNINCGAIPENLLESELFGHEKGSFTGAHATRAGRLELAHGGTVFLDEIGEIPISLQVKLLRFLQEHEIERVGGRTVINLDVRIIAATSRDLEAEVSQRRFRQDLYYRLAVVNLDVPALRERQEDILVLAQYFLDRFSSEMHRGRMSFSPAAKLALREHSWPGNVRELEHRVQKAVVMAGGRSIEESDLELSCAQAGPRNVSLREAREEADRAAIREALRATGGNVSKASEALGISRPSLHELLAKLGIQANDFRARSSREEMES
ncbi:MAG: PEP-CTERM-box response regulator transcription factor [Candidatus Eisenbacteria bacterium]|nr:PEP-CTERM-box response regulator transcription factor [Candidatus Eisenbacteria bacterium]